MPMIVGDATQGASALAPAAGDEPLLVAEGLSKRFGARYVLWDAGLSLRPGEVRGLLGQNGSGKSTFIKILSGFHTAEPGGSVRIRGRPVHLPVPERLRRTLGLAFVHQDLALAPDESVTDNLRVNLFSTGHFRRIRWQQEHEAAEQALAELGLQVDPRRSIGELSQAEQTVVALARAIGELGNSGDGILVLDEVTASLPLNAVRQVFVAVRALREQGVGVLYVSHRLEEVFELTDSVTVLRDGRVMLDEATAVLDRQHLIQAIVGADLPDYVRHGNRAVAPTAANDALRFEEVDGSVVQGVTVDGLDPGTIVGFTGLIGSGFEELLYLLSGARSAVRGRLCWKGHVFELASMTPGSALARGIALLPADRKREGGLGEATVKENVSLPHLGQFWRHGWLSVRRERVNAASLLGSFQVRPDDPDVLLGALSGGNQQKALLAKVLAGKPEVLMLVEPTHGIDVATKKDILEYIRSYAGIGNLVLLASSEYEELANVCDRVLILREGRIVADLVGADISRERLIERSYAEATSQL